MREVGWYLASNRPGMETARQWDGEAWSVAIFTAQATPGLIERALAQRDVVDKSFEPLEFIGVEMIPAVADVKQTNPKDAVGIRKAPMSALPWRVLWHVGLAMMEGALKYGRHNYRAAGVRASVYFDATVSRHIGPWWEGQDIDPDSGKHHIDKAIAALMVMRDSMLEGNFVDDRPPRGLADGALEVLNAEAGMLLDRYGGRDVHHHTIMDAAR